MLYLIGTGLFYLNDLPLRAVDLLSKADEVFMENYTNLIDMSFLGSLEKAIGKKITLIGREETENESILADADKKTVCLLVPGDPLAATTHMSLILACRKSGIKTRVVHASSIFSAIAETGLSLYKFGATVSIPLYEKNFTPDSFFDGIKNNLDKGFHTLVLLEARSEKEFVDANTAVELIKNIEKRKGLKIIDWRNVLYASRLGSDESKIGFTEKPDVGLKPPISLVIPGRLNEIEKEALDSIN